MTVSDVIQEVDTDITEENRRSDVVEENIASFETTTTDSTYIYPITTTQPAPIPG